MCITERNAAFALFSAAQLPGPGVHLPREITTRTSVFLCKKAALTPAPQKPMAA